MRDIIKKLRLIYLPFLLIAFLVIFGYTFLNWLVIIKLQLFNVKDFIINYIIPFAITILSVWIWLTLRIRLLNIKNIGNGNLPFLYHLVAVLAITIPTIIFQHYIDAAAGKLTNLDNIEHLNRSELTKYYTFSDYYIDKNHISTHKDVYVSGKHNESLNFCIYVVCPILKDEQSSKYIYIKNGDFSYLLTVIDGKVFTSGSKIPVIPKEYIESVNVLKGLAATRLYGDAAKYGVILIQTRNYDINNSTEFSEVAPKPTKILAWIGVNYKDEISNRLSDAEKNRLYNLFIEESKQKFENQKISGFKYLKRMTNSNDLDNYKKAIESCAFNDYSDIVFEPEYSYFEDRLGNMFPWIFGAFGIGASVFLLMILIPRMATPKKQKVKKAAKVSFKSVLKSLTTLLNPKNMLFVTGCIIAVNVLIYIIMVFSGLGFISFSGYDLIKWGSNYSPATLSGQWWRLFTSIFLHGGLMHLAANMYGLLFVGIFLESRIGKIRFALIYVGTGIAASAFSIGWHDAVNSVGASGAIFGMYGLLLALMLTKVYPKEFNKSLIFSTIIFVGFNLLYGLTGGIDNAAHIGGLISGFITGLTITPILTNEEEERMVTKRKNASQSRNSNTKTDETK